MSSRWSWEKTEKFVKLYREHENLWNTLLSEYRDRERRLLSLQTIAEQMNLPNFGTRDVSRKIKTLRSCYSLEVKKIQKSKKSGTGTVYKPSLTWFNDMAYVMRIAEVEETGTESDYFGDHGIIEETTEMTSDPEPEINFVSCDEILTEPIKPFPSNCHPKSESPPRQHKRASGRGRKRKLEVIGAARDPSNSNNKLSTSTHEGCNADDECDIMGKHIAIQLRSLPVHERVLAHLKIHEVLVDFRLRNINSLSVPSSSTVNQCKIK
ncbi:uncharacterized protein LOC129769676 [Toxorhynchites rutilus septentrionalis]|uniref:uncharacterized protein LOC129769676 n=1 Tax=Toxorhynchites rutilus septentrionalis TaxID=329112 RepID=UPI002479059C|nr:uncharacterized protein LOC129769676 [Toxorhynchites rutilus septentrionalis]